MNSFETKTANTVSVKVMEKSSGKLEIADYDGSSRKKPSFYTRPFHVKNVTKLVVPMIFLTTKKLLLYTILYNSYIVLSMKEYKSFCYNVD
jgi:hypothetical protein